jgi:hypothetical protein
MALVTKVSPSIDANTAKNAPQITGLYAGEALEICAPCYIASADGLVYMCNSTNDDEETEVIGFTARAVAIGEPVTLFGKGMRMRYAASMTPGNYLYVGTTNGRLDTVPQAGSPEPVAVVLTATDIMVVSDFRSPHGGDTLRVNVLAGAGAGADIALAAIAVGDQIVACLEFATAAAIATLTDRTANTTIKAGGGNINIADATDNDAILLIWNDLT